MMTLLVACLAIAFPFLLIFLAKDQFLGTLKISAAVISFYIAVALIAQIFGIFYRPVVLSVFLIADLAIAIAIITKRGAFVQGLRRTWKPGSLCAVIALLIAFAIIGCELYSVHYKYTGEVDTLRGSAHVTQSSYGYPLFSDEWVAAALARSSIASHSLPMSDPLAKNKPLADLLVLFHSGLTQAFLLGGLDPVSEFAVLAICTGILFLIALYACLRSFGAGKISSLIILLVTPLLAQGTNLPGFWFLLPFIVACMPFFLMLASLAKKAYGLACIHAMLAMVIYPPMAIFVLPSMLVAIIAAHERLLHAVTQRLRGHATAISVSAICAIAAASVIIALVPAPLRSLFFQNMLFGLFHANLDPGIASYPVWGVVPIVLLPFAFFGMYLSAHRERSFFLVTIIVGLLFWSVYAFYSGVIVIEYPRIVMITSFALMISAGIGIERSLIFIKDRFSIRTLNSKKTTALGLVGILLIAGLAVPAYARTVLRGQFLLTAPSNLNTLIMVPSPAVTRYLAPDDLLLWRGITGTVFIAPPWKSLVIGTVTGNYPLQTKSSYITEYFLPYTDFMSADCSEKAAMAKNYGISYAYADAFSCPGFTALASSSEDLILYHWDHEGSAR